MARTETRYVCGTCGATSIRWEGQCRSCAGWNTLVESLVTKGPNKSAHRSATPAPPTTALANVDAGDTYRLPLGIREVDRVLGGGLVPGSLILLGGEPGIGKSTLVLSVAAAVAASDPEARVLYASGEESAGQIRLRAARLGVVGAATSAGDRIDVLTETSVERIVAAAQSSAPALLIVDSIQTLTADDLDGPQGSVGQVRSSAARLQSYAKESGVPLVLVGHVTKDGSLAGPKTLEHLVDVVLTLEGERLSGLRLLRSSKNRFGSTEEVGVFEMTADGLAEVADPAAAFIEPDSLGAPGVAVAATLEGSRPLLVEVQALVTPAYGGSPRRTVSGLDPQRLALLIAVLGRRAGFNLAGHDVYASVVGGLSVDEPAIDLPLAVALASALRDKPLPTGTVLCGEIGLTGELRPVSGLERRLREAARLGFVRAIVPERNARGATEAPPSGLTVIAVPTLRDALVKVLGMSEGRVPTAETVALKVGVDA
ncbi:MAG TPA: DNA repair protein RadA [Candidatus Limnocylindrales bacterium]|nr:DNA repair protein RadA [Candidatus Limnocylindrales bacterium]